MAKGGRPGAGGGITVHYGNGVTVNYISNRGRIFDADSLEPIPANGRMTLGEVARRAQNAGYKVETRTAAQERARVDAKWRENASKPDYQYGAGAGGGTSRAARKTARNNRLTTRVQNRARRR